ncbi:hypothetical protein LAP8965_03170 [Lactiplantibacillus plantarum]|nr:hypothetical protein LAP8963_03109 [Lactiplantibacillus plantarum]SPE13665.1 hypothetical protein LAP8964_03060 [Lactiplantibacillus plantarum]SPH08490.1 hypothetical protein LAP8965_03170 [Lactiplantibacillus plantarum]SPH10909.1 hypothetical protein LAP8966_03123 [Lactiplantibacillus plantarum]
MKKRLRQKRTRKRDEDRLAQSIKQMETALDGYFSHVTVHTVGLTKKAPVIEVLFLLKIFREKYPRNLLAYFYLR